MVIDTTKFQTMFGNALAHSANEGGVVQTLFDHARQTAIAAGSFASKFDMREWGELLGWLHDIGKLIKDFQEKRLRGFDVRVDHAIAGTLVAHRAGLYELAFAIAGHHGGIPDKQGGKGETLRDRKRRAEAGNEIPTIVSRFASLVPSMILPPGGSPDVSTRMLASCLVDADYLDTERHFDARRSASRRTASITFGDLLSRLLAHNASMDRTGPLNALRQRLFENCLRAGDEKRGVFRLEAPTGAGKTLASVAFAIRHAMRHGLDRVIFSIPFTSIIEQNADVLRSALGDNVVLEHQSALPKTPRWQDKLAAENWSGFPVVVTTNVQLLESLFGNTPRRLRKLHNIANSVLVFDEVQTLPPNLLEATLSMLRDLREHYGVSVVFSSATQPGFDDDRWGLGNAFDLSPGIASDPVWDRVAIEYAGETSVAGLAAMVARHPQCLIVVNTTKDARNLANMLPGCLHLSSRMCPQHRRWVLAEVKRRLTCSQPCTLVSTQVVEAGCDISFPVGFRAVGPLDSIWQVAGRINRHGEFPKGQLGVVFLSDGGRIPGAYSVATGLSLPFVKAGKFGPMDQEEYFRRLYGENGGLNLDKNGIQHLRANAMFAEVARRYRLVEEDTEPVVVPYGDVETVLRRIEAVGRVRMDDHRLLRQYMVSVRPSVLGRLHIVERAGLPFCSDYSDMFGVTA